MATFMDVHSGFVGVTAQQLQEAHERDLAIEAEEGVHFERAGLLFQYVNIDLDPDALAAVHGAGYFQTPVIVTPAGRVDEVPSDAALDELAAIAMENEGGPVYG